jgi:hypothetical protein
MIEVKKIVETTCDLYNPKDVYVGTITSILELNDVRIQIKKQNVGGYYIKWKDYILDIDNKGYIEMYPPGFYDLFDLQLEELLELY